jgi:rare lipoprotein A
MSVLGRMVPVLAGAIVLSACASHGTHRRPARGHVVAPAAPDSGGIRDDIHAAQDQRYRLQRDGGPQRPDANIATLAEPVPKDEPRSRYGNKSPYTVNGHTYQVLASADGYDRRGLASWYGNKFNGYLTSSMERYDMYKFTAASKVLPLPTFARVTNLANGKSVIVRVNDRGPFMPDRIIDLSYAAAVRIGIWPKGTGMVEVKAIDPEHPAELTASTKVRKEGPGHALWLQVGAFARRANAQALAVRLRGAGIGPVKVSQVTVYGGHLTRVRVGPLHDAASAGRVRAAVRQLGLPTPQLAVD